MRLKIEFASSPGLAGPGGPGPGVLGAARATLRLGSAGQSWGHLTKGLGIIRVSFRNFRSSQGIHIKVLPGETKKFEPIKADALSVIM